MSRKIINYKTEFGRFKQMHRYYREIMPIISEGDSWYSYPLAGANLMDQLLLKFEGAINYLRLESSGHEALDIFESTRSGQLKKLIKHVKTFQVPIVLMSAGGNDVVGRSKKELYDVASHSSDVDTLINSSGLNQVLQQILDRYSVAINALVNVNPAVKIITHTYDYPAIIGKAAPITIRSLGIAAPIVNVLKEIGPWIKPILVSKNLTDFHAQYEFAKQLIDKFHDNVLVVLKNNHPIHFDYIDLRGTLQMNKNYWNDEIHPNAEGFRLLADKFWLDLLPIIKGAYVHWRSDYR
ncbi:MAG: hypothetical protein R3E90_11580 [Marinicella sp.]